MGRKDHVAYSDGRCQGLGKCIHIYYLFASVYTEQSRQWLTVRTELTVIIILYYIASPFLICPGENLITSVGRHGYTCREMMVRADVGYVCSGPYKAFYGNAAVIHVGIAAVYMILAVYLGKLPVAGIFNAVLSVISQKLHNKSVEILCSRSNHYLVRINQHTTEGFQVICYGLSKLDYACGQRCLHKLCTLSRQNLSGKLRPDREWKAVRSYLII